ncbi:MAG TPA: hypothetical protein VK619_02365 [Pyrinomonadaceae bacterium]|nr:hypothetical protein [Pyrinomonadaceae bacterium]
MRKIILTLTLICALAILSPTHSVHASRNISALREQAATTNARTEELSKGQVIERVVCRADAAQSYALYLPSNYTPARKWPMLYAFDPLARGRIPVELFREAAEKYGWIIVGSNNSRNGPMTIAVEAIKAVWADTHARFSVDDRRIYATGFSGGARVASIFGGICGDCVAGVIGCGAGLHPQLPLAPNIPFNFFGTIGTNDFNFPELKALDEALTKFRIPHRVALFDGTHEWAPQPLATEAIEWMEIQAIKSGRRTRDEALVNALWRKGLELAHGLETSGKIYEAYQRYDALYQSFDGLLDASDAGRKIAQLRETDEVKKALREENEQVRRQQLLMNQLGAALAGRNDPDSRFQTSGQFKQMLAELKKNARENEDTGQRRVARRVLNALFARFYETGTVLLQRQRSYDEAVYNLEIAAEIAPKSPQVFFDLARAYALNGDKKKAIQALRTAVGLGFTELNAITSDAALDSLRGEASYREIVEGLKNRH